MPNFVPNLDAFVFDNKVAQSDDLMLYWKRTEDLHWIELGQKWSYLDYKDDSEQHSKQFEVTVNDLRSALNTRDNTLLDQLLVRIVNTSHDHVWLNGVTNLLNDSRSLVTKNQDCTVEQIGNILALYKLNLLIGDIIGSHAKSGILPNKATIRAASECLKLSLELDKVHILDYQHNAFLADDKYYRNLEYTKTYTVYNYQRLQQVTRLLQIGGLDNEAIEAGWELINRCANIAHVYQKMCFKDSCERYSYESNSMMNDGCLDRLANVPTCDENRITQLVTILCGTTPQNPIYQPIRRLIALPQAGTQTATAVLKRRQELLAHMLIEVNRHRLSSNLVPLLDDELVVRLAKRRLYSHQYLCELETLPLAAVEALSRSSSVAVRSAIAARTDTPAATLTMLGFDRDREVAITAVKRLKSLKTCS